MYFDSQHSFFLNFFHYHFILFLIYIIDLVISTWHNPATPNGVIHILEIIISVLHDDVIKWKHFPRYWPFVRGKHRSPVNSPHKGQWRGALMLSLICDWINGWVNNREAGNLRHHRAHYDVIVMKTWLVAYIVIVIRQCSLNINATTRNWDYFNVQFLCKGFHS